MSFHKEQFFKICPMCAKKWMNQDNFLDDPMLIFDGYQANFEIMEQGLFYFTHDIEGCGSTMILKADMFVTLYTGPKYEDNKQLSEGCPGLCLDRKQLGRCPEHCEFAFVREISQIIKDRSHRAAVFLG